MKHDYMALYWMVIATRLSFTIVVLLVASFVAPVNQYTANAQLQPINPSGINGNPSQISINTQYPYPVAGSGTQRPNSSNQSSTIPALSPALHENLLAPLSLQAKPFNVHPLSLGSSTPIQISPQTTIGPYGLVTSGNNIYSLWSDESTGNWQIYFSESTNEGNSFSSPVNISKDTNAQYPSLAASGNYVYVAWIDYSVGSGQVFFSYSMNGGDTFSTAVNLSNDAGPVSNLRILASESYVYVSWYDQSAGNNEVLFRSSADNGNTFGSTIVLANSAIYNNTLNYELSTSGNNVYFDTWDNSSSDSIYFAYSNNGGTSFSSYDITNYPGLTVFQSSSFFYMYPYSNSVYLVSWSNASGYTNNIYFISSTNTGSSFGSWQEIAGGGSDGFNDLSMQDDNGNLYLSFTYGTGSNYYVDFMNSSNGGNSWQDHFENIYYGDPSDLEMASYADNVYLVWLDNTSGNDNPFVIESTDDGNTFGNIVSLNNVATPNGFVMSANGDLFLEWDNLPSQGNSIYFSVVSGSFSSGSPTISSFTANPVLPSAQSLSNPAGTSDFANQICDPSITSSIAGCIQLAWFTSNANTCSITTNDTLVNLNSEPCDDIITVPLPATTSNKVAYAFTLNVQGSSSTSSPTLIAYALPTTNFYPSEVLQSTIPHQQFSQAVNTETILPSSCDRVINLLGCWWETGSSDSNGIPIAVTGGYGFSMGEDYDSVTATYATSSLGLPSNYNVDYYVMANTWTEQLEGCGAIEGGAGTGYQVMINDDMGNSFASSVSTNYCANLIAPNPTDLGGSILDGISDAAENTLDDNIEGVEDQIKDDAKADLSSELTTEYQNLGCSSSSGNLCQTINDLGSYSTPEGAYYGKLWSTVSGGGCNSYSVAVQPLATEASIGVLTGAAQAVLAIPQVSISGVAVPDNNAPTSCGPTSLSPSQVTLTSPNVSDGGESLINGQIRDAFGNPVSDTSVGIVVTEGSLSSSTVTTDQNGLFSDMYTAPTNPNSNSVTVTASAIENNFQAATQQNVFTLIPAATLTSFTSTTVTLGSIAITPINTPSNTPVALTGNSLGNTSPSLPSNFLNNAGYYDIDVNGMSTGNAQMCINDNTVDSSTTMEYWNGAWSNVSDITTSANNICGVLPVSDLSGTIISVGDPPPPCIIPTSNWTVSSSCTLQASATAPANVIVQSGAIVIIPNGLHLNIDFTHYHLLVSSGGGVLIKAGGAIN